jgi:putative redox protein
MAERMITVTVEETGAGAYTQSIKASAHDLSADEPVDVGGLDTGPSPYDLLLSALGACTSMTLRMYANQKKWELKRVTVKLTHKKEPDADNKKTDIITRDITLEGNLDDAQRLRLLEIANKCPVHRTLTEEPRPVVTSRLVE